MPVKAWADTIFLGANLGLVAPPGSELSADVNGWKQLLDRGTFGRRAEAVLDNAFLYHGVGSLKGRASPILFQTGWTDALFPVPQALAEYRALRKRDPNAPVSMRIGDLGHGAANHPLDTARFDSQGKQVPRRVAAPEGQAAGAGEGHRAHADLSPGCAGRGWAVRGTRLRRARSW